MAPPLQWSVIYLAMFGMNATLTLVSLIAAILRKEMTVKWITAVQYLLAVGFEILSAISYSMVNDQRECFSMILWIPTDFAFASCLILFESQLVKILLLYTCLGFTTNIIRESLYVFDPLHSLSRVLQSFVTFALLVACSIQVFRWRALKNARRLVCKDQASYSVVWAALIAQEQNLICLSNLKREIGLLQSGLTTSPPKQIFHVHQSSIAGFLNECFELSTCHCPFMCPLVASIWTASTNCMCKRPVWTLSW